MNVSELVCVLGVNVVVVFVFVVNMLFTSTEASWLIRDGKRGVGGEKE